MQRLGVSQAYGSASGIGSEVRLCVFSADTWELQSVFVRTGCTGAFPVWLGLGVTAERVTRLGGTQLSGRLRTEWDTK